MTLSEQLLKILNDHGLKQTELPTSAKPWSDLLQNLNSVISNQEYCRTAMNNLPYAVAWFDANWCVVGANKEYQRLFSSELCPSKIFKTELESSLTEGKKQIWTEFLFETQSDGPRTFNASITKSTETDGIIFTLIDISKEKEQAKEIDNARSKTLESARMAVLGEMAAGIAHEVNNPLAIIQGLSQQIILKVSSNILEPEFILQKLEKIVATSARIAKIIKGLRAYARDSDKDPYDLHSIKDIIEDTLNFCHEKTLKKGISLILPEPIPEIRFECRPAQISQVLLNLISNSCDAIEELEEKWIRIEVIKHHLSLELSVIDSGPGIPVELQKKILLPFFTTKEVGSGTGLGLSTSKGLIEQHNGVIKIDSSAKNTKFTILLPLTQEQQASFKVRHSA